MFCDLRLYLAPNMEGRGRWKPEFKANLLCRVCFQTARATQIMSRKQNKTTKLKKQASKNPSCFYPYLNVVPSLSRGSFLLQWVAVMVKFITNKSVKRKWLGQLVLGEPDASPPSRISDRGSSVLGGSAASVLREHHRSWEGRRNSVLTEVGGCAGNDISSVLMNSVKLWLSAQDWAPQHSSWMEEGPARPHSFHFSSELWCRAESVIFFSGVCSTKQPPP